MIQKKKNNNKYTTTENTKNVGVSCINLYYINKCSTTDTR